MDSPEALAQKIVELTDVLTGSQGNAFSADCIVVRVEAPGAPDLTMIDLPGIVRTHTAGQDPSVVGQVGALITTYLRQERCAPLGTSPCFSSPPFTSLTPLTLPVCAAPCAAPRTIILAVVPANQDIATIDILERARLVDPLGDRTMGVLTKPDLVGPGSEAEVLAVLRNERKPLKLGYVMVKCRSQRELDAGVTPEQARVAEGAFFAGHADWCELQRHPVLGVAQLIANLTVLLVERIQTSLPFIKWELQSQLLLAERALQPLGRGPPVTAPERRNRLMKLISCYCNVLRQSARGFYSDPLLAESPEIRLFGRSQAAFEALKVAVTASRPCFADPRFAEQLAADMAALRGREIAGFHNSQVAALEHMLRGDPVTFRRSSQAFYNFVAKSVENWRPAVETCKLQVVASTRAVSALILQRLVPQYPALGAAVTEIATRLVNEFADELAERLGDIFKKESDPFTTNENMLDLINQLRFRNFDRAMEQVMASIEDKDEKRPVAELQNHVAQRLGGWYMHVHGVNIKSKVEDMIVMIEAYWDVATKRLVDNVCMSVEHDFVGRLLQRLESECFLLATEGFAADGAATLAEYFDEDPVLAEQRRGLVAKRDRLEAALGTLRRMAPDCVAQQQHTNG